MMVEFTKASYETSGKPKELELISVNADAVGWVVPLDPGAVIYFTGRHTGDRIEVLEAYEDVCRKLEEAMR